jgi:hypothetical protein
LSSCLAKVDYAEPIVSQGSNVMRIKIEAISVWSPMPLTTHHGLDLPLSPVISDDA